MRVIQIREPQPPVAPSLFKETVSFFSAVTLFVACYILLAAF